MNLSDEEMITKIRRDGYENMLLKRFTELIDEEYQDELYVEEIHMEHKDELDGLYDDIDKLEEENFHLKKALKEMETLVERQLQEIHYAT